MEGNLDRTTISIDCKAEFKNEKIQKNVSDSDHILENAYFLREKIDLLQKQILELKSDYDRCIEAARCQQITRQGSYKIERIVQRSRVIQVGKFLERYPEEFVLLASVPVTAAERIIGKEALSDLVEYKIRERYIIKKI